MDFPGRDLDKKGHPSLVRGPTELRNVSFGISNSIRGKGPDLGQQKRPRAKRSTYPEWRFPGGGLRSGPS